MNSIRYRLLLLCGLLLVATSSAVAQTYPFPAATPNTDVPCTNCPGRETLQTIGYPPVLSFVGRWADAEIAKDYQQNFRTARPRLARVAPSKNRLYTILGSALAAYDVDRFLARLSSRPQEALSPATIVPTSGGNPRFAQFGPAEVFLWWDAFFYAENGGGWKTAIEDGLIRLWDLDWDDRGNVYLAYSVFGWGIVKDDGETGGGWFHSVSQVERVNGVTPDHIIAMKTSDGHYYAAVSDKNTSVIQIWDTTNAAVPVKLPDTTGRSFYLWAKDGTGTHVAVVEYSGALSIYTPDAFVRSGQPLARFDAGGGGAFKTITTDGTNFYAYGTSGAGPFIDILSPSGGTYAENRVPSVGYGIPEGMHYNDGYLASYGAETAPVGTSNIRLYKVTPTPGAAAPVSLTEISFDMPVPGSPGRQLPFWSMYYGSNQPSGYAKPFYNQFADVTPIKRNGKLYLVISAYGLGDVWEVKSGDSISARLKSSAETVNPNSAAAGGSGPFYGDRQTFTSALSSGLASNVTWDFGDSTSGPATAGADIKHQYGGVTSAASLPLVRRATVTSSSDPSIADSTSVTLAAPTARVRLANTSLLFPQADASAAAIITSDTFADASDGSVEGHYSEWVLDGTSTKKLPSELFVAGVCGTHTLRFNAHYGPYTGTGNGMSSSNTDLVLPVALGNYTARPYAVTVQEPSPSTVNDPNAVFTASARTAGANDVPGGLGTDVTYTWELVNGSTVLTSSTGSAKLGTIPSFRVPKTTFSTTGLRVRLTTTVAAAALPGAGCGAFATSVAQTNLLNGPDPVIVKSGCATVGAPCSFTVTSATNPTLAGWSIAWNVTPNVSSSTGVSTADFRPQFTTTTDYSVGVTVTNGIGSATRNLTALHIDKPLCSSAPDNINMSIGADSNTVRPGDVVSFLIFNRGWEPSAPCDKFAWTFGDGGTAADFTPTHVYQTPGSYTVTLTLTGALATGTYTTTINVIGGGGVQPQPQPQPQPTPTPTGCTAPSAASAYITYFGSSSSCTASGGTCTVGEPMVLDIRPQNGFDLTCGSPTASWSFGDNTSGSGLSVSHVFAVAGIYHARVTLQNSSGSFAYTQDVTVGSVQPKVCGILSSSNVAVAYTSASCSDAGGACKAQETMAFRASSATYDFTCNATHTYDWDFGDGSAHSTAAAPSHTFAGAGTYAVKLIVSNGTSSATVNKSVVVAASPGNGGTGSCPTMVAGGNVYIIYFGENCSVTGGNCSASKAVSFQLGAFGYSAECGTPAYSWDFGDGTAKSTVANPSHKYANNGTYKVTLTFSNGGQTLDLTEKVNVTGGAPVVPPRGRAAHH